MGIWFIVLLAIGTLIVTGMSVSLVKIVRTQLREGELRMRVR
ncbi:hypothetical protein [Nonomuraea soli]|uniref:Uncharacterized protein n=1 Tax=Nonomuraea soli TaxID=1032476 RepID=A0A7W0CTE4_9ACTN|nr:hypothetical protein [Nonomuraea soli]MBA2896795.1 hypothetical protein [Nonomuraea soli]